MAKVSLRAYNREIEAMVDRGHLDEAVAHCQHILKIFPKHLETYRLLGKAYLEGRRHNEAVDIFSRVLNADPSDFVAHVGMSIIRDEQGKLDDAIWHMERAFEVQSANPAIQGELQRLYGRRDGAQPPRIRMTRGALAHMYMRGELFPQAISESKGVLEEDQGRTDMQVLLAKAYYRSGQKKDAADSASGVLKRFPFSLDANLVLAEALGADRPESAQAYRQRVVELDPYAAQAVDNMFLANEVSDAAVSLDHLEWNGQPVGMTADWGNERAIGLESGIGTPQAQPDWLKDSFSAETSPPLSAPTFDSPQDAFPTPAQPADDIPDFLRAAGWGASTGAFDESKSSAMFADQPAAEPLAQGDLPEWVKAMAPQETSQPAGEQEEEMPDWINKIGTGALATPSVASSSGDQPDWLTSLGEESSAPVSSEQPDWMKDLGQESQPAAQPSTEEQPDWMKGFGEEAPAAQPSEEQPDWMKVLDEEKQTAIPSEQSGDFDFITELTREPETPAPSSVVDTGSLGTSAEERDDSFAWLENLAAKQGATEGLLTKPEERLEDEPDWIKQAKGLSQPESKPDAQQTSIDAPPPAPVSQSSASVADLGKSGQEIDDALAWFESLAVKQGATEGLLTKPEERLEQEPDWVKQAKSADAGPPPVPQAPVERSPVEAVTAPEPESVRPPEPAGNVDDLGKSGQEIDDALAWFESLAVKQGATEGLLTKPEERSEQEPEWVKRVKKSTGELGSAPVPVEQMAAQQPPVEEEELVPEPEPVAAETAPVDDVSAWLKGLDDEGTQEPAPVAEDDTASWLKSLDEPEDTPTTAAPVDDDLPAWLQDVSEEESPEPESATPAKEADFMAESPAPMSASEEVPSWLGELEAEEEIPSVPASDDLPAWMRDETGELVAEPTRIEPTRATDWTPADAVKPEPEQPPPPAPQPAPEPKAVAKPKKPAPKKQEAKPAAEPYKEPVTIKGTGMLTIPVDPILGSARAELSRSNIPGALETYGKLIKKGRFLEETIFDLREALYRYPVEVSIWQALGDAYMRANQLQDALDAYTKAEELLR